MPRNRYTKVQIDNGKKRLKSIRQKLKTRATPLEIGALGFIPCSARGVSMGSYVRPGNLKAVVIHPVGNGWVADLLLKKVPAGTGDVLGSPDRDPMPTYEDAVAFAELMVEAVLQQHAA